MKALPTDHSKREAMTTADLIAEKTTSTSTDRRADDPVLVFRRRRMGDCFIVAYLPRTACLAYRIDTDDLRVPHSIVNAATVGGRG